MPSGASTGAHEAVELRDGDSARYGGKGVRTRCANVVDVVGPALRDVDVTDQRALDETLIALDGTPNKGRLGANALLGVSLACAHASAAAAGCRCTATSVAPARSCCPVPLLNVLNGGMHAQTSVDFQEFMLAPLGLPTFADAMRAGSECFHALRAVLHERGREHGPGRRGRVRAEPRPQ